MSSYRDILKLVWPLALGMINNAVMQFVDRAYLACHSQMALEAVLPASMLTWIFAGFFQSVVGYSSVLVGVYHGANDGEKCRGSYAAALVLAAAFGLLSLPLVPLGDWIFALSAPSEDVMRLEKAYFGLTMAGAFAVYGQMAASSYFTGRGKTRLVFWVNVLGNLLNIALDPLLIFVCDLGIAGAAIATVFSTFVQMVVLCGMAHADVRRERLLIGREPFGWLSRFARLRPIMLKIIRYGVPSGFYTCLNCLSFTIFVFVTGGVGELELAVSNACFTVNYLLIAPMEGFALGASTLVAQAIGRNDRVAARRDARRTIALGVGFVAGLSALVVVFAHPILSLFAPSAATSPENAAAFHSLGVVLFLLMAAWQVFDAADVIVSGALKGAGDTRFVMGWMICCSFGLWLPLVFLVRAWRNTMPCLWGTMIVYVVVICIGSFVRWCRGGWEGKMEI